MPDSFGTRLRQQRERQRIALATITEHTKIKQSLLEALERDDLSRWPGGIFRRAYIRAYAQAIGLEPDAVVREFVECFPDPTDVARAVPQDAPAGERDRSGPPTRLRYLVESAFGSLSSPLAEAPRKPALVHDAPRPADVAPPRLRTPGSDLAALADLCTALGRAAHADDVVPLLGEVAHVLDAVGLIVWVWDPGTARLRPALAHGYSEAVLVQVPALEREAGNATAAAFRLARPCVVEGGESASGALVVPLLTASGCAGVLAVEFPPGGGHPAAARAVATIVASHLASMMGAVRQLAGLPDRRLA